MLSKFYDQVELKKKRGWSFASGTWKVERWNYYIINDHLQGADPSRAHMHKNTS